MKKTLKSIALAAACVLGVAGLVACEEKHEHAWSYESDPTKHRQVCDCEEKTEWEPHVWGEWVVTKEATEAEKGSRKHTCTVCGEEVSEDLKQLSPELAVNTAPMAVYAQVPADWETVNIYYWNGQEGDKNTLDPGYAVGWPGVPMTLVDENTHLWGYEIPVGVENVIFYNGSVQTVDIALAKVKNLYVLSAEANAEGKFDSTYSTYTPKDTDPELAKPVFKEEGYVISYVTVLEGWENANVYWYGSAKNCDDFPGVAMTAVEGATNVYTFDKVPDDATHVIFSSGDTQTIDIPVVKGLNGYIIQEEVDEKSHHLAKNGDYNLATKAIDEVTLVDFYAQVPAEWEEVYIHFWEGAAGLKPAGWPGVEMTVVDADKHIYKYTIDSRVTTIIIDAGEDVKNEAGETTTDKPQTPNTLINVEGVNGVIVTAADNENGAQAVLAKYENETMTEVTVEKTTPVFYVVGSVAALGEDSTWQFVDAGKLEINADETEATITLSLAAGDAFKVSVQGWAVQFKSSSIELGTAFAADGENIKVVTPGTYVFTVSDLQGTPTLTITAKPADPQPQPSEATPHTDTYDYALITDIAADKAALTQENFTGANAFLTVNGSVTYRNKQLDPNAKAPNCIEIKNDALQVTFKGTGTITITFSSTGSTNKSRLMLKAADGTIIEGETTATKITATEEGTKKNEDGTTSAVTVDEIGAYEVTGTTMVTVTFTITEAGTYTICSPSGITGRGCRIGSIVMVDNYKDETQTEAQA